MQTLIATTAVAAIVLFFVGLIRPRWAFLRARWQVLIAYPVVVMVLGVLAGPGTPPVDSGADGVQAIASIAAAEGAPIETAPAATEPAWTPALKARWCAVLERKRAISRALTKEGVGANPSDALQAGDTLTLQEKSVINPTVARSNRTMEEIVDEIGAMVQVPPGATIKVLERTQDDRGNLLYVGRWVERDVTGRIDPSTLMWLNTMEAISQQVEAREEEFKRRWHPVLVDAFGSLEAANTVEALAADNGIYTACK